MVRVGTGAGTESTTVQFSWPQFAEALRVMTYSALRSQAVPLLVHRAFGGDHTGFAAAAIQSNRQLRSSLRFGFLLAITCTEDVARIDPRTIERETANPYLGDSRVREQMAARAEPNSIHVVAPGGHVPHGPCIDAMERAFLDAASPRAVDTSCVASMRIPDFFTSAPPPARPPGLTDLAHIRHEKPIRVGAHGDIMNQR
jgi:hypothetical protein